MIGFETIGNATLICHDEKPILATDPWLSESAYFGSWTLSHAIPTEQIEHILTCKYIWLSHGHPDHLDFESLNKLRDKIILLPDHVGQRISSYLIEEGFTVHILKDREWFELSTNIKVMCLPDYNQDATLLVDLKGKLIVNFNDSNSRGWEKVIKTIIRKYDVSFMLKLFGYGDADMNNFFEEDGHRILPEAAEKYPVGEEIQKIAELYGTRYVIPFSTFHAYQRKDSAWANDYTTPISAYSEGFHSKKTELLPAFIQYDCITGNIQEINPKAKEITLCEPEMFGDRWSDCLEKRDVSKLKNYFMRVESIHDHFDFVNVRVGGIDHFVEFGTRRLKRGLTFEAPRTSLMTAVEYEIFDDMLIGNFMKTTLHGGTQLYPYFTPYVAKYSDNGRAKTKEELKSYMRTYRDKAPLMAFVMHRFMYTLEIQSKSRVRAFLSDKFAHDSYIYKTAKQAYYFFKGTFE